MLANSIVIEVENCTQIDFVHHNALVPLEFRHIGEPLFIWPFGTELAGQKIFSKILRGFRMSGTAATGVLDRRLNISRAAEKALTPSASYCAIQCRMLSRLASTFRLASSIPTSPRRQSCTRCIFSSTPIVFFYLITPPIKDSSFFTVFYRGSSS